MNSYLVSSATSTSGLAVIGALECPAVGSSVFSSPLVELITWRTELEKRDEHRGHTSEIWWNKEKKSKKWTLCPHSVRSNCSFPPRWRLGSIWGFSLNTKTLHTQTRGWIWAWCGHNSSAHTSTCFTAMQHTRHVCSMAPFVSRGFYCWWKCLLFRFFEIFLKPLTRQREVTRTRPSVRLTKAAANALC